MQKYDLSLPMNSITSDNIYNVGFLCREIDKSRISEIQSEYGQSIFITCGKSANLNKINIKNFEGTIFTTSGIDIEYDKNCNIVKLPLDVLDTQNYIAASDMVITKAGWGTIAEAILGYSDLVMIERPSAKEDTFNIDNIVDKRLGISISEDELNNLDILEIRKVLKFHTDYNKLHSYKNNISKISELILK